ncbi:type 2 lanthipeptide synthetase LanM family protein [Streptomyces sp. NPDC021096]|uniref:type 2 lanthipeptide synthetase LanM family protein n=1 Tax=Streptomyces sp. NPDC021096 TaxID=3154792 RepID=UPI003400CF07
MTNDSAVRHQTLVDVDVDAPAWHLAASLEERLGRGGHDPVVDRSRGRRRLDNWKAEKFFTFTPGQLADWLAALGLDEPGLVELLGETPESVAARSDGRPDYVRAIERAWAEADERDESLEDEGFAALAAPLVEDGKKRIRAELVRLLQQFPTGHIAYEPFAEQLCLPPGNTLLGVLSRTMVLELNVLRVEGGLQGDSPCERYRDFLRRLRDPAYALGLLREYPVLARDLVRVVDNWVAARTEFARRLLVDLPDLLAHFDDAPSPGQVSHVAFDAGDSHRGGRSVGIVHFSDGRKVVYKPRSLSVDVHFQALLRWLDDRGVEPGLRPLWIVDRVDHGWTEFVTASGCADRTEVARFYERQGAYLAVLYCLAATDFHYENLIASGEHPVLVDLEALFHPRTPDQQIPPYVPPHAVHAMSESVLSVGLLPTPIISFEDEQADGLDLSGLSSPSGQLTPTPVPTWSDPGTDRMRLVRRRLELKGAQNMPSLADDAFTALDYQDEIIAGFRRTYRLLLAHREALLAPGGPIDAFATDQVRVVLRGTRVYGRILQEGYHPDLLRDGLDRDRFYSLLWGEEHSPVRNTAVSAAELAQLSAGDIPIFSAAASSRDLLAGNGTLIPEVLEHSGMDRARARIEALSEEHLARQTWFLRASLTGLAMGTTGAHWPGYEVAAATAPAPEEAFTDAARRIGDRLLELAVVDEDRICWLGLTLVQEKMWQVGPASVDLYNGISGISLFLAHLAEHTGEAGYRAAAEAGARVLAEQFARLREMDEDTIRLLGMGACAELGGPVYALSHLGALWNRPDLLDTAALAIPHLRTLAPADRALDIVSGSAGALLSVLALHSVRPDRETLEVARLLAGHLVGAGERVGDGIAWPCSINPDGPLTGFSHGASGIAVALARLDAVTGRNDHADVIRGALRFERATFDPAGGSWPDLRNLSAPGDSMVAWCHGAAGIGMARAALHRHFPDDAPLREDLDHAVRATLGAGFTGEKLTGRGNHSICHGDLGNLETLLLAAQVTGDASLAGQVDLLAAGLLAGIAQEGPLCGVPLGVETPGLMAGLAGIGYNLLRFAKPGAVPSVLLLEGPERP